MNQIGQVGTFTDGQVVTIIEVYEKYLFVQSTTGAKFTIKFSEFTPQ